jgi:hypothetical protein
MRRLVTVLVTLLVVVLTAAAIGPLDDLAAGPNGTLGDDTTPTPGAGDPSTSPTPDLSTPEPTPSPTPGVPDIATDPNDVIGWENGYWYNASLDIDQRDGLSPDELDAVVARSMARVEIVRGLEFKEPVTVEVITREQYQQEVANESVFGEWTPAEAQNEQVWEALFIVGEDADVREEFAALSGSNVLGYYDWTEKKLVLVSPDPNRLVVDPNTLAHELVHALQDQYFDLAATAANATVQDTQLARNGLIEGEANYVGTRYMRHCATDWECLDQARTNGGSGEVNVGLLLVIFQPYSDGPVYVENLVEWRGWAAVNDAHRDLPQSSETIIHLRREAPDSVYVPDRAQGDWSRIDAGGDVLGEASIYSMFWAQAATNGAETVDTRTFFDVDSDYDTYHYVAPASAGWGGDRLYAYQNGGEYGYVWKTTWDTPEDATEFRQAYLEILKAQGAENVASGTYVVTEGPYADAFRVVQSGQSVVVVNGPSVESLNAIDCSNCGTS